MDVAVDRFCRSWRLYPPNESETKFGIKTSRKLRNSVLIAILLLCMTVGLSIFGKQIAGSEPLRVDSQRVAERQNVTASPILPNFVRDPISKNEASLLAEQKLGPPGMKSLLKVPAVMRHGDFVWNEEGVPKGEINIWVDLSRQMISAYRNGHEIGTAVIVYGAEDKTSPEGRFPVLNKQRHYHSRTYDAPMPASLFITNDGVALHGSPMSSRRASHGCIGLPVEFAEKLFDATAVGNVVEITRSTVSSNQPVI